MQDLTVTLVQANQIWEDKQANFQNYDRLLSDVEQTHLILLPEMFNSGFSMNTTLAEDMSNSESLEWLRSKASEKDAAIYTSLMIREKDITRNRGVFIEPNGAIHIYDKRKSFGMAGEDKHFKSGSDEVIVEYLGWKFMLQICYDLRFPEIARNRIEKDGNAAYDVLLYVANWPEKRVSHWNSLLNSRAIENQCYSIGVNRIGTDGNDYPYTGNSKITDALGKSEEMPENTEGVKTCVIKYNELLNIREMLPFLKDR